MAQGIRRYWEQKSLDTELVGSRVLYTCLINAAEQACWSASKQAFWSASKQAFWSASKQAFWPALQQAVWLVLQAAEDLEEILGSKTEEPALPASNGSAAGTNGASAEQKTDTGPASNGGEGVSKAKDDMLKKTGGIGSNK